MAWQYLLYLLALFVATAITTWLAIYAWQHREVPEAPGFVAVMIGTTIWSLVLVLIYLSPSAAAARFWSRLWYTNAAFVPLAWLTFALYHTGQQRWLTMRRLLLLSSVPVFTVLSVWTDDLHGLFIRSLDFYPDGAFLLPEISFGFGYIIHSLYSYALMTVGIILILRAALRAFHLYRAQALALIFGAVAPVIASIPSTVGLIRLETTSLGFALTGVMVAWALFRYQFLDLVPVARDTLIDSMNDGLLVLDPRNRIVDLNPAMAEILDIESDVVVGQAARDVPRVWNVLVEEFQQVTDARGEICLERDGEDLHYDLNISPLMSQQKRLNGRMIVLRDVTARKAAEEALRQQTIQLRARNEELDSFAHTVAHDLKNPLTSLIGFSSLLQSRFRKMDEEDLAHYLGVIAQNGRKMTNIINEILLLASVRKLSDVEVQSLDMAAVVAEARSRLVDMIANAHAEIVLPKTWPAAFGYPPWVEEIWANYISNAIKYGGRPEESIPPYITLGATPQPDGTVRFWVKDNGRGLTEEEQSRLFAPFERLEQTRAKGHGLGLSIVRRISEKLGGSVGMESQVGEGSVFWFSLPAVSDS